MASVAMHRALFAMALAVVATDACAPVCADHALAAVVSPAIVMRDVDVMLTVTFTGDVLTDADAAQQLAVRLVPPNNGAALAIWSGGMLSSGAGIANVAFSDPRTMHVTIHIDAMQPAGDYSLDVTTRGSGSCAGPNATVTLRVQ